MGPQPVVARNEVCGRGRSPLAGMSGTDSTLCAVYSSSRATTVSLGLIERLAPVGQKLGDESMLLNRLHGQRGQCKGDGERYVIAHRAGCQGSPIGGMGLIDPDGGFDEPAQFRVIGTVLKLNPKPVPHRSTGTSMTRKHG